MKQPETERGALWRNLGFLFRGVWKHGKSVYALLALHTLAAAVQPFIGILLPKLIIDGLSVASPARGLYALCAAFAGAAMLVEGVKFWTQEQFGNQVMFVRLRFMNGLCEKLMTMAYWRTEDADTLDRARLAQQAYMANTMGVEGTLRLLFESTGSLCALGAVAVLLFGLHPALLLFLLLSGVADFALQRRGKALEEKLQQPVQAAESRLDYLRDTTADFKFGKDIRLYQMRAWLLDKLDRALAGRMRLERQIKRAYQPQVAAGAVAALLRDGLAYLYLIVRILSGGFTLGDFTMYFTAVTSFSVTMQGVLKAIAGIRLEMRRVQEARSFQQLEEDTLPHSALPPRERPLGLELKDVCFTYKNGKTVLEHFNLRIQPGEHLAVVGLNGAGKSTLIKLMARLYEPQAGQLLLAGQDARTFDAGSVRGLIAPVFQEVRLFAFTLAENVAMQFRGVLDEERVWRALELAGLAQRVKRLPKGIDTVLLKQVDSQGLELSGGENQKLALARALYKDAPILLLDEPTAALDPIAEAEVYTHMDKLIAGRSALYISHRLSACRFCDVIAVLEDGRLAQWGSHEELLRQTGPYAALFQAQAQYYA